MFDASFNNLVEKLLLKVDGPVFNIAECVSKVFFDSICYTLLEEVVGDVFTGAEMEE